MLWSFLLLIPGLCTENEGNQSEPRSDKSKLRLAASSPNIKALFDANPPSSNYNHNNNNNTFRQPEQDFSAFYPPSSSQQQFNSQQQQQQTTSTNSNTSPPIASQSLNNSNVAQSPYGQNQALPAPSSGFTWGNAPSVNFFNFSLNSTDTNSLAPNFLSHISNLIMQKIILLPSQLLIIMILMNLHQCTL